MGAVVTRQRRAPGSPIPHTGKHQFLIELHDLLRPDRYLEIGVQFGNSLWGTRPETMAIGVDPAPMCAPPPNATIYPLTADGFFAEIPSSALMSPVDLAFLDGSHLVEDALRDFMNVERHARPDGRTVVVFDDVLPYSPDIAGRTPLPGDWTGDVWKIDDLLSAARPDLVRIMVDVAPTGALVVLRLDPSSTVLARQYQHLELLYASQFVHLAHSRSFRQRYVERVGAVPPAEALDMIRRHLNIHHEGV